MSVTDLNRRSCCSAAKYLGELSKASKTLEKNKEKKTEFSIGPSKWCIFWIWVGFLVPKGF